jgi:hypothetical protein
MATNKPLRKFLRFVNKAGGSVCEWVIVKEGSTAVGTSVNQLARLIDDTTVVRVVSEPGSALLTACVQKGADTYWVSTPWKCQICGCTTPATKGYVCDMCQCIVNTFVTRQVLNG